MKPTLCRLLCFAVSSAAVSAAAQSYIPPSRPVPAGKAPGMRAKLIKNTPEEQVYTIIFAPGDEALSGLTDFAAAHGIGNAHFTAVGASRGALLAWFDLQRKQYRAIPVQDQTEVLAMTGDIADHGGKPIVHTHAVLGRRDGSTVGGHVFELHVDPTLEVFLTADAAPLAKKPDARTGLLLIDPAE